MKYRRFFVLLLCIILLITSVGCEKDVPVPELMKPIESLNALYTVEKTDMERNQILSGFVAPEIVKMSFDYSTTVEDVAVRLGDHVTEGQLLFLQNPEAERLARELSIQIEIKEATYELDLQKHEESVSNLKKYMRSLRNAGDYYNANLVQLQIDEMELRFEWNHKAEKEAIEDCKEELTVLQEQVTTAKVVAPCDGIITFIDVSKDGDSIREEETFLMIAKDNTRRLACDYIEAEVYEQFSAVQAQIGGTKYDVTPVTYTDEELVELESNDELNYSYFTVENLPDTVQCGDFVAFYVTMRTEEPVLAVPKEAVTKEGGKYFVSVVNGMARESREVTIGSFGLNLTEITSGLTEGEVVFVAKDLARFGVAYETAKLQSVDLSVQTKVTGFERYSMKGEAFLNPVPGEITEIHISNFSQVSVTEGQELYTVQPSIDKADWEQTKIDLANFEKEYEEELERLEEDIKEYKKEIKKIKNELEKELAEIELERKEEAYEEYVEDGKERIEELQERVANYELWSKGPVTVCAEKDGVISSFSAYTVGEKLRENQHLCDLYDPNAFCLLREGDDSGLRFGMKVEFSSKLAGESFVFSGTVVSSPDVLPGSAEKSVIVMLDENRYMEGNNAGTILFMEYNLEDITVLPNTVVYHETTEGEETEDEVIIRPITGTQQYIPEGKPYVWVYDANGCAVKRYVTVARYSDQYWICDGLEVDDVVVIH